MKQLGRNREYKYDVIRIILTSLVVIGHANYYNAGNAYGGVYILDQMTQAGISDTVFHGIAEQIKLFIYTFHMPAFFALSGALFYIQIECGRFASVKELAVNKISRLLVPFVVVYLLWNTPIKILSGFYSQSTNLLRDIAMQMIIPTNVYLWYLEALFIDFIIAFLLYRTQKKCGWLMAFAFVIYLLVQFLGRFTMITRVFGNPLRYLLWFILGMNMEKIMTFLKKSFSVLRKTEGIWLLLIFWIAGYYGLDYLPHLSWIAKDLYLGLMGTLTVWCAGTLIAERLTDKGKKYTEMISSYTFGIYLYAEPLNYLFIVCIANWFGLGFFGTEWGALFIWLLRIVGTTLIAMAIVRILKKINLKITLY